MLFALCCCWTQSIILLVVLKYELPHVLTVQEEHSVLSIRIEVQVVWIDRKGGHALIPICQDGVYVCMSPNKLFALLKNRGIGVLPT